jgi:hypothetical protein
MTTIWESRSLGKESTTEYFADRQRQTVRAAATAAWNSKLGLKNLFLSSGAPCIWFDVKTIVQLAYISL